MGTMIICTDDQSLNGFHLVLHLVVTTCAATSGNGPKANEATDARGSVLFVEVVSIRLKDQSGVQMEAHDFVTLRLNLFSCGQGLTAARR